MKRRIFRSITLFMAVFTAFFTLLPANSAHAAEFQGESDAKALILMEAETGTVLYEKNADQALPPASVTKVMSMLLVMEAVDSGKITLDDMVTVSEYAANMGGSQVYLEAGETFSVHELLKCVVVSSANDACVALAEHICGSEEGFVAEMNKRASELGMANTNFENTNGLDDDTVNHVTSARDIAIMSAELISNHPKILEYSTIWMDSIRNGEFGLTNTNRLIRFYSGANGLKTGSTSKAKFCISASAKRNGMQLICVVMGASTRDSRNEIARKLLDFGFAGYAYECFEPDGVGEMRVVGGKSETVGLSYEKFDLVTEKQNAGKIERQISLPESVPAPIKNGDAVGSVKFLLNGEVLKELPVTVTADVERVGFSDVLAKLMKMIFV